MIIIIVFCICNIPIVVLYVIFGFVGGFVGAIFSFYNQVINLD